MSKSKIGRNSRPARPEARENPLVGILNSQRHAQVLCRQRTGILCGFATDLDEVGRRVDGFQGASVNLSDDDFLELARNLEEGLRQIERALEAVDA